MMHSLYTLEDMHRYNHKAINVDKDEIQYSYVKRKKDSEMKHDKGVFRNDLAFVKTCHKYQK